MKTHQVTVIVWMKPGVLDPQARQALRTLQQELGFTGLSQIRLGSQYVLTIHAESLAEAKNIARESAKKRLCNAVIQEFWIAE